MAKIRQSNLDNSIVTGLTELTTGNVTSSDQTIIYDASSGTLKKITQQNFLNFPNISSVSPTSVTSGDGTGNYTFTITGSGFTGGSASLINNSGTTVNFDTVTVDSATQITGVIAKSSLPGSGEPYDVRVTAATGLQSTLENQINIDQSPTYNTASGSLGSVSDENRGSTTFTIEAYDPESAGNVTFEIQSGSLPSGASTSTVHENGVSKFIIAGTFSAVGSDTTSNFTLRAVDAASNTSSRAFSIIVQAPKVETFTSSGTFSVPSGTTTVDVLIVGGGGGGGSQHAGGGGAGGLIFISCYPVTPGGTVPVTVGCGGSGGSPGGRGSNGQDSYFGTLNAKGGGGGGGFCSVAPGLPGGSGGGGGSHTDVKPAGSATQPTQPGQSGANGHGNPGGVGNPSPTGGVGGGGGGAGAAGSAGNTGGTNYGGPGGIGNAYTIADNSSPVYYAGGGGAGSHTNSPLCSYGVGGQGGGGDGGVYGRSPEQGVAGQANKGGGGGGSGSGSSAGREGGKGVVIVRWS